MLNPLSAKLLEDLNEQQKNIAVSIMEKNELLSIAPSNFPSNIVLEPSGKAVLRLQNNQAKVNDIYEVMEILQEIVNMAIKNNKPSWLNDDKLKIQRPVINVESENPSVVFKVLDGKPGAAGAGPVNAPSRRMVAPILLGRFIDPKDDTSEVYLYGQRFDYNISLNIYAKSAHEADILKEWISDIIKIYLWYVRYSGVLDFTFTEETGDETEALRHKRILKYAVSIEKLTWSSFFALKEFVLKLSLD